MTEEGVDSMTIMQNFIRMKKRVDVLEDELKISEERYERELP